MTAFDAVTREVCVARREATVTPLQSLVLLNDPQFVEASRILAQQCAHSGTPGSHAIAIATRSARSSAVSRTLSKPVF